MVGSFVEGNPVICGGYDSDGYQNRCSLYSFGDGSWNLAPFALNHARYAAASVALPDGGFLVMGGRGHTEDSLTTTEILSGGTFEIGPDLPERFDFHCSVLANDTHVFLSGGTFAPNSAYFLEISSGSWTRARDMRGRYQHTCGLSRNGEMVVAGGYFGNELSTSQILDMEANEWREG